MGYGAKWGAMALVAAKTTLGSGIWDLSLVNTSG